VSAAAEREALELAALIAQATSFSAHIRRGPFDKTTIRDLPSFEEARRRADELDETSSFGRRAIVYAITPAGRSVPCTAELVALARSL